jgi:tetratricopeptide (TPR) repeat protein
MNRTLGKLALGTCLVLLALPLNLLAGRGGGGGRGGYGGGGQMGGGSMGHSPSFSQPHQQYSQSGNAGNHSQYGNQSSSNHNAGAAAAGAGYANHNQTPSNHNTGAAAAGAGYANHNQGSSYPNAGAAAGAGYANRNQGSSYPNAGAAAAGAGYANRNQGSSYSNAGAAAAGAGYADNHNGTWNGNNYAGWGATGLGTGYASGVAAWGTGSPMYGWGYSGYSNPYYGGGYGSGGVAQTGAVQQQPDNAQQTTAAAGSNYSQPISTTTPPAEQAVATQASSLYDQARDAFKAGNYSQALQLDQQALAQTPNDTALHEFLALVYFAQGNYQQAAAPLYAVLSTRPGWDWTTLSGMYPDVDTYTSQLRALEAYVKANPDSAQAHFGLAYQYLTAGHDPNAITQLKEVVRLQPGDTLSAQIIAQFQPSGGNQPAPAVAASAAAQAVDGKLAGTWAATPAQGAKIALAIQDNGTFTWTATGPGKPPMNIAGKSTFAGGTLTLLADGGQNGALVGQVTWKDADDFTFRLAGGPPNDPGLKFAR